MKKLGAAVFALLAVVVFALPAQAVSQSGGLLCENFLGSGGNRGLRMCMENVFEFDGFQTNVTGGFSWKEYLGDVYKVQLLTVTAKADGVLKYTDTIGQLVPVESFFQEWYSPSAEPDYDYTGPPMVGCFADVGYGDFDDPLNSVVWRIQFRIQFVQGGAMSGPYTVNSNLTYNPCP